MRIRRSRLAADFVQIPNGTVRDDRLSYMARGILAELLSRPDGWESTADDLWRRAAQARDTKGEGRRAFRAAFAELKEYGYLVAERAPLPGGRHATVLIVRDTPGHADVPPAGTSEGNPNHNPAAHTDVPHAGTSEATDVPPAGTSESPAQTHVSPGRTDVPPTDVPHAGTSKRKRSTNTGEKTSQQAQRGGIPDRLDPLRTALAAAGLGAVAWDIRKATDWERIRRQTDRLGIDLMVRSAVNSARSMGEPASVVAWISRWESLAEPQPQAQPGTLPAAIGQVLPLNPRPSTADQRAGAALAVAAELRALEEGTQP